MTRRIEIHPVTRIEGHAKVLIDLADDGSVEFAGLIVNELRGFERILVGMEAGRMPLVTARICGVCPSAHHLAAVKAIENALEVVPPPAARRQRELLYMGHLIHSHAVHLFALAGPDLFLGLDSDPASRNIVGMIAAEPELAGKALRLRSLGQRINERLGGRGVHPVTAVIGGMATSLDEESRRGLESMAGESVALAEELVKGAKDRLMAQCDRHPALLAKLILPTAYLGSIDDGNVDFYDGRLHLVDHNGAALVDFAAADYDRFLVETATNWSYMKPVHIDIAGQEFDYQVGSLARLNCADALDTPLAQKELERFRSEFGRPCHLTVLNLFARLIELLHACEKACDLARHPDILGEGRIAVKMKAGRGVGHVEAPRGALFHDYLIDDDGIVRSANLIVATQQNFSAINRSIKLAAAAFVADKRDGELLNAIEFAIRCYDPCLSCATHALGRMPLEIDIRREGKIVRQLRRGD